MKIGLLPMHKYMYTFILYVIVLFDQFQIIWCENTTSSGFRIKNLTYVIIAAMSNYQWAIIGVFSHSNTFSNKTKYTKTINYGSSWISIQIKTINNQIYCD